VTNEESTILKKIKKLLALSKDRSNVHEAELAAQKAQELLFRYNLAESQAEGYDDSKKEPVHSKYGEKTANRNLIQWQADLANTIAQYNLCKIYYSGPKIVWVGRQSNIEVAEYLFNTLVYDLKQICDKKWKQIMQLRKLQEDNPQVKLISYELRTVHGKTWKNSFYIGAVFGIGEKLREQYNTLKADPNMNALIVVNNNDVQTYYDNLHLNGSKRWGNTSFSGSGFNVGKNVGRNINFRTGVTSGGSIGPKQITGKS
jgi:hypothetical protein